MAPKSKVPSLKEYVNEHGKVIVGSTNDYQVGDIMHVVSSPGEKVQQPFRVMRIATLEEYLAQPGITNCRHREMFYEIMTD